MAGGPSKINLTFELTLAPAYQVVRGSDTSKLVYKLKNIQLEYERIRSEQLADHATTAYTNGKGFAYDQIMLEKTVTFDRGTDADLNLLVNPQRRSLKGILLLFIVPYTAGARDTENYFNPDITNVEVTLTASQTGFTTMASKGMTCGVRQAGYLVQKARNRVPAFTARTRHWLNTSRATSSASFSIFDPWLAPTCTAVANAL